MPKMLWQSGLLAVMEISKIQQELEKKLFSCGFEVEELTEVGKEISKVVVGSVEECEPIPETHLHVCRVNAGSHYNFIFHNSYLLKKL